MKDRFHQPIKEALQLAGWDVRDDHRLKIGVRTLHIDLSASMLTADRGRESIAVEVKDFNRYHIDVVYLAIGQYLAYKSWLARKEPHRKLFLGVSDVVAQSLFLTEEMQAIVQDYDIRLLTVNIETRRIITWN